ncbi:MAG: hypothetical protein IT381_07295 [Deltaproteobacteria bacterium]|nr:hypothetical protein [Deltaproteobacteria bacterium]
MTCNPLYATCIAPAAAELPAELAVCTNEPGVEAAVSTIVAPPAVDVMEAPPPAVCEVPAAIARPEPPPPRAGCSIVEGRRRGIAFERRRSAEVNAGLGFDPNNATQVRELQQLLGVTVTGTMNPSTRSALNRAIRAIQTVLLQNGACDVGTVDGIFGPRTAASMRTAWGANASVMSALRQLHAPAA